MDLVFAQQALEFFSDSMDIVNAKPISDLTTNEYNAMLAGIVHGVIEQEHLTEIQTCIGDGKTEATNAYQAFENLWQHQWMTGIKEIAQIVEGLPTLMTDCTSISEDVATLESWASVFLAPASLESVIKTNVTHNLIKLTRDLHGAKKDWSDEHYYAFGTDLGVMLTIATQPLTAEFEISE